ncbi:MAG: SNF2-related protein, partial [Acidobacteria bacterium]|nr:SNF2-related protein [Acidobacteriota bacterium]
MIAPTSVASKWVAEASRFAPSLRVVVGARPYHLLVLDEAQMIKNARSKIRRCLRRLDARHRLCITGAHPDLSVGNELRDIAVQGDDDQELPSFLQAPVL